MTRVTFDGDRSYSLGADQVTLSVDRIVNLSPDHASNPLQLRLYALESGTAERPKGHVVAEADLPPIEGGGVLTEIDKTVPMALDSICLKAMKKDPALRYPTPAAF